MWKITEGTTETTTITTKQANITITDTITTTAIIIEAILHEAEAFLEAVQEEAEADLKEEDTTEIITTIQMKMIILRGNCNYLTLKNQMKESKSKTE